MQTYSSEYYIICPLANFLGIYENVDMLITVNMQMIKKPTFLQRLIVFRPPRDWVGFTCHCLLEVYLVITYVCKYTSLYKPIEQQKPSESILYNYVNFIMTSQCIRQMLIVDFFSEKPFKGLDHVTNEVHIPVNFLTYC